MVTLTSVLHIILLIFREYACEYYENKKLSNIVFYEAVQFPVEM